MDKFSFIKISEKNPKNENLFINFHEILRFELPLHIVS